MKVLVACEFSGIVRDAFIKRGHDAMSCDLLPTESEGPHYQGDVLDIIDDGWDLMIAHPPCTYLSKASARWLYPKAGELDLPRFRLGLDAHKFFCQLWKADIEHIVIENPTPLRIFKLPIHSQVLQPYEYGHPYSKRTLLWLKHVPQLQPTNVLDTFVPYLRSNTGYGKRKGQKHHNVTAKSTKDASRFWTGVAKAMADQWGSL